MIGLLEWKKIWCGLGVGKDIDFDVTENVEGSEGFGAVVIICRLLRFCNWNKQCFGFGLVVCQYMWWK